jgi:hypothetical protein
MLSVKLIETSSKNEQEVQDFFKSEPHILQKADYKEFILSLNAL